MRLALKLSFMDIEFPLIWSTRLAILLFPLLIGCEGPAGPPGIDAEGVDVTPPTIELTEPHPLDDVWDEFKLVAAAVDNVSIREVVFTFDGSQVVNGELLIVEEAPYEVTVEALGEDDVHLFESGWHFVAARAYDAAGNVTDSPIVPIRLGYSKDLQDTVEFKYHNGEPVHSWVLPDTAGSLAYWSRFHTPTDAKLISVRILFGGSISDSCTCFLRIMEGTIIPGEELFRDTLAADILPVEPSWLTFDLSGDDLEVDGDFFVMVDLPDPALEDSLVIMSDDGLPPWWRCGSRDERGYYPLYELYGADNNFLVTCRLYFEVESPPDTTLSFRNQW